MSSNINDKIKKNFDESLKIVENMDREMRIVNKHLENMDTNTKKMKDQNISREISQRIEEVYDAFGDMETRISDVKMKLRILAVDLPQYLVYL